MAEHQDFAIVDARLLDPASGREERGAVLVRGGLIARSEERRVGKECRSRWSPYH